MLEIIALWALTNHIGNIVEQKGHKSGWHKVLTVVLWVGGEIIGAILGATVIGARESAQWLIEYLFALLGAAVGAGIAYLIAKSLSPIDHPLPTPPFTWSEVWKSALIRPSVATFEGFVRDPNATSRRAYAWVFVSALIGYAISIVLAVLLAIVFSTGPLQGREATSVLNWSLGELCCGVPIQALLSVLGLMISAGITQLIAGALGGTGRYSELVYAFAAYLAPLTLITNVLRAIPFISLLNLLLWIHGIMLTVIAVKAVKQFGWGKAIASSLLILIGIPVLITPMQIAVFVLSDII